MPDHVHLLITPFQDTTLDALMRRMKGASGHEVNRLLGPHGAVWQRESFDHILRNDDSLSKKAEYIANNPVRAGLVTRYDEYRWWWRAD
jgi:REP element-mobilizing transposase RayT